MILCFLAAVLLTVMLFVIFAPGFLFRENLQRKADAVVLFVGPGNEARLDEARQLIKEGYARYLLVPFSGEGLTVGETDPPDHTRNHPYDDAVRCCRIATPAASAG